MSYEKNTFSDESTFEYITEEEASLASGGNVGLIAAVGSTIAIFVRACRGGRRNPRDTRCTRQVASFFTGGGSRNPLADIPPIT